MNIQEILQELQNLELSSLYERDFWDVPSKGQQELAAVFAVADALRDLRDKNYATTIFNGGLAVFEGEKLENPAFAAACAMLGLQVVCVERLDAPTLAAIQPDILCPATDRGALCDQLYRQGTLAQRPLSLPRRTALPMLLDALHTSGGVREMWGQELLAGSDAPQDAATLAERFGLRLDQGEADQTQALRRKALEPYVLAAMILLGKCPAPVETLNRLQRQGTPRRII